MNPTKSRRQIASTTSKGDSLAALLLLAAASTFSCSLTAPAFARTGPQSIALQSAQQPQPLQAKARSTAAAIETGPIGEVAKLPLLRSETEPTSLQIAQSPQLQSKAQSTSLQTGTQSTSLHTGTQSTTLQTGTQSTTIQGGTRGALIQGGVEDASGPMNVLILLDASYSMKEKITGRSKMECAKQVLESALARIPNDINVGLRVFGQQYAGLPEMDCRSSILLVPLGTGNRRTMIEKVRQIEPYGLTPLTYALACAAEDDFRGVVGRRIIILITDGMDTCGQNPCAMIAMLPRFGIKIKVDVVGVDLKKDPGARSQLNCIAETSGGKYYDANTAAQLIDSVSASFDKAISGRVVTPSNNARNTETPPELIQMHASPDHP